MKQFFLGMIMLAGTANAQLPNGSTAPNFTLTDIFGNTHTLYDYLVQGKAVYIDFFACHCPSCWTFHQTGKLESLYQAYGPDGTDQLMVFMIEYDQYNDSTEFYGTAGMTQGDWVTGTSFPIFNPEGADRSVLTNYNVVYYPMLYKICPDKTLELVSTSTSVADMYQKADDCAGNLGVNAADVADFVRYNTATAQLSLLRVDEIECLNVYSVSGELIFQQKTFDSDQVDLSQLNAGIYLIKLSTSQGELTLKLVRS